MYLICSAPNIWADNNSYYQDALILSCASMVNKFRHFLVIRVKIEQLWLITDIVTFMLFRDVKKQIGWFSNHMVSKDLSLFLKTELYAEIDSLYRIKIWVGSINIGDRIFQKIKFNNKLIYMDGNNNNNNKFNKLCIRASLFHNIWETSMLFIILKLNNGNSIHFIIKLDKLQTK